MLCEPNWESLNKALTLDHLRAQAAVSSRFIKNALHEAIRERDAAAKNRSVAHLASLPQTKVISNLRIGLSMLLHRSGANNGEEVSPRIPRTFDYITFAKDIPITFSDDLKDTPIALSIKITKEKYSAFANSEFRPLKAALNPKDFARFCDDAKKYCLFSHITLTEDANQRRGSFSLLAIPGQWIMADRIPDWLLLPHECYSRLTGFLVVSKILEAVVASKPVITTIAENEHIEIIQAIAHQGAYHLETSPCGDQRTYIHLTAKYLPENYVPW